MKIFLGSSSEAAHAMHEMAAWLPKGTACPWSKLGTFRQGHSAWDELLRIADTFDGALFVLAEDDLQLSRSRVEPATRDNVWLEYGLCVGAMGRERVRGVVLGKPKRPSDLLGITLIRTDSSAENKQQREQIRAWAIGLAPRRLRGLTDRINERLQLKKQLNIDVLLLERATRYRRGAAPTSIRALCSSKGRYAEMYYEGQFVWVRRKPAERRLQRIFVRKQLGFKRTRGFSTDELREIRAHLQANAGCKAIKVKWIWAHDDLLGPEGYDDTLGFALIGRKWIVHYGVKSGWCYERPADYAVTQLLVQHFNLLWNSASRFDYEMLKWMFDEPFARRHA